MFICPMFIGDMTEEFDFEKSSYGGWIEGYFNAIKKFSDVDLSYTVLHKGNVNSLCLKTVNGTSYRYLEYSTINYLKDQISGTADVYHVFGTEMDYAFDCLSALNPKQVLIYIQGLTKHCAFHYQADCLSYKNASFLFKQYLQLNQHLMEKKGSREVQILKKAIHVVGRTDFDEIGVKLINPYLNYYKCNEILRHSFYDSEKWTLAKADKHTIYVSQASYPLKGCHLIIECVRHVKEFYPDVKCYIGGENLMQSTSLATSLGISYAALIKKMIKKYSLEKNIIFIGNQTEQQVVENLKHAQVFLLSSSLENSPNSLAEAMILGVPCVSSFVGGVSNFAVHGKDALLYPYHEPYLASKYIMDIFGNDSLSNMLSKNAIATAEKTYNREINAWEMVEIYKKLN